MAVLHICGSSPIQLADTRCYVLVSPSGPVDTVSYQYEVQTASWLHPKLVCVDTYLIKITKQVAATCSWASDSRWHAASVHWTETLCMFVSSWTRRLQPCESSSVFRGCLLLCPAKKKQATNKSHSTSKQREVVIYTPHPHTPLRPTPSLRFPYAAGWLRFLDSAVIRWRPHARLENTQRFRTKTHTHSRMITRSLMPPHTLLCRITPPNSLVYSCSGHHRAEAVTLNQIWL